MKTVLVLLAKGTDDIELVITTDVLRRAGVKVIIAGIEEARGPVECSRGIFIVPDCSLAEAIKASTVYSAVVVPGGAGYLELASSAEVGALLKKQEETKGIIAAIGAAPVVLKIHGITKGRALTSHPTVRSQLVQDYRYSEDRIVVDGSLVTSRASGTAFSFALALVGLLTDRDTVEKLKNEMLL